MKCLKIPVPLRQYKFHPSREYAADFCWPQISFIVEVDGGSWMEKSGHTTGVGYAHDRERDAEAFMLGFKVLRVIPDMVEDGRAIKYIQSVFEVKK